MTSVNDLSPREFEDLSVEYLRSKGFADVRRVGQAGDLGIDIRCKDDIGRLVVAQCKRYRGESKIGSPEIQTFFGMTARARAARGVFITASTFTDPARRLAHELDIELVDGREMEAFHRTTIQKMREAEQQRIQRLERTQPLSSPKYGSSHPSNQPPPVPLNPSSIQSSIRSVPSFSVQSAPPRSAKARTLDSAILFTHYTAMFAGTMIFRMQDSYALLAAIPVELWMASEVISTFAIQLWIYSRRISCRSLFQEFRWPIVFAGAMAFSVGAGWYDSINQEIAATLFVGLMLCAIIYIDRSRPLAKKDREALAKLHDSGMKGITSIGLPVWFERWRYFNLLCGWLALGLIAATYV